ncbi:MAG: DUF5915 domain-containing protein, partial [Bacteroidota bacterium]|nr:DUF5915 domain-containing protein [Bacteroidota bacterium]
FESVHLSHFPKVGYIEKELEEKMEIAQKVVYLTRAMRAKANLKVRQPLAKIMVVVENEKREALAKMKEVILEEVNIKDLIILEDDSEIVNKSAKANFKSIGPKFGKKVKAVSAAILKLGKEEIKKLENKESITLTIEDEELTIVKEDVEIISSEITGWVVESEEGVTVAIDASLTDDLISEGLAREFVNRIQNMRKDSDYNVIDRIHIRYNAPDKLHNALNQFSSYIANETLASSIEFAPALDNSSVTEWKINEYDCSVHIEKVK